jgi:outer membrane receptor protein involved in Fe transport
MKYADESYSSLEKDKRYAQDSYRIVDLAWGVQIGSTDVEVFARNITDERAQLYFNDQDDIPRITTNRPRNVGIRLSYKF